MQKYSIFVQPGHIEKTDDLDKAEEMAMYYASEVFDNEINEVVFDASGFDEDYNNRF